MTTENSVGAASDAKMNRPTIDWRQIHCNVRRLQVRIVKATQEGRWGKVGTHQHLLSANRVLRRALERLERAAGKLARRVLRGRGGSNVALLPDVEKKRIRLMNLSNQSRTVVMVGQNNRRPENEKVTDPEWVGGKKFQKPIPPKSRS